MRFVPIKTVEQQAAGMGLKTRELLVRQRVQVTNALRGHLAELGVVAAKGRTSLAKLLAIIGDRQDSSLPDVARMALQELVAQIRELTARVERLDQEVVAAVKAVVPDPAGFRSGRDFAARIGLTPRSHSSGGKERLGAISKRGNKQLRTLLIVGAISVIKLARLGMALPRWTAALLARRPFKVVAVALANKIARIIWALLVKGGVYRAPPEMAKA
jgi:transposase